MTSSSAGHGPSSGSCSSVRRPSPTGRPGDSTPCAGTCSSSAMVDFTVENLSAADVERLRGIYGPLTPVGPRTHRRHDPHRGRRRRRRRRARPRSTPPPPGCAAGRSTDRSASGSERRRPMPWGNPVIGLRNPIAPPLVLHRAPDGSVYSDFHLGAAFEGPPGHVHGGVSALMLDHVLGEAASDADIPTADRHHLDALPAHHAAGRPARRGARSSAPRASRPTPSAISRTPTASPWRPRACSSRRSGPR